MNLGRAVFATLIAFLSILTLGQSLPSASISNPQKPQEDWMTFPPLEAYPGTCRFLQMGKITGWSVELMEENDVVSKNDQNYTHGLNFNVTLHGEQGKWSLIYDTKLWSVDVSKGDEFEIPSGYGGEPRVAEDRTYFYEKTELRLKFESEPDEDNTFYRVGVGIQQYGNKKNSFGGRAQQETSHPYIGSSNYEYVYGDVNEVSGTLAADIGKDYRSQSGRFFCRPEVGVELNTQFERAYVHAGMQAGATICSNNKGDALVQLVGAFDCYQYSDGERDTRVGADLKFNLPVGERGRFSLVCGAMLPLEQNEAMAHFTDDDLIGRVALCYEVLIGPSRRR